MKRTVLIIVILIASLSVNGQRKKLDEKNGFNKFQLKSQLTEVKKLSKLRRLKFKDDKKSFEWYDVTDINNYKLFGYPLGSIKLQFYKGSLCQIVVDLPTISWNDENQKLVAADIRKKIESEYGSWYPRQTTLQDTLSNVLQSEVMWGTKVSLFLDTYKSSLISDFNRVIRGDRYVFVSKEIYDSLETEASGL